MILDNQIIIIDQNPDLSEKNYPDQRLKIQNSLHSNKQMLIIKSTQLTFETITQIRDN